jgi:hypothetical protein
MFYFFYFYVSFSFIIKLPITFLIYFPFFHTTIVLLCIEIRTNLLKKLLKNGFKSDCILSHFLVKLKYHFIFYAKKEKYHFIHTD